MGDKGRDLLVQARLVAAKDELGKKSVARRYFKNSATGSPAGSQ